MTEALVATPGNATPAVATALMAGRPRETLLVYRHRLAPRSEVGFLRRCYIGFEHFAPVWLGCHIEEGAAALSDRPLRLGRSGALGVLDRTLFRQTGRVPTEPDLAALRPRLIHAHFGRGGALALPLAQAFGIPLVVTFHGGDATKERHYRRRLLPAIYQRRLSELQRQAALFVCVSDFVRQRLLERGFPAEKLAVIPIGVEIEALPDVGPPRSAPEPLVLFVGRFTEKKGAGDLIAAMQLLQQEGSRVRLMLIGDGPLDGALHQQAQGMANVTFSGWLPNHEVRRRMRQASAVCVPSMTAAGGDSEGLPSVVFEAMAEGAPIIATRHAGIAEAVAHERTGLLVPPNSPSALADAIARIACDPALAGQLGAAARAVASERFDAVRQSRRLEAALLRVLGDG